MSEWRDVTLGDVLTLQRGFDLPARDRKEGSVPVVSSAGVTGRHSVAKVDPPGVVIGRYGSLGSVHWVEEPFWPLNTALWVKDFKGNDPRFISYLLKTINMDGGSAAAVPGVNRNHLHRLPVRVPTSKKTQAAVAAALEAFDQWIAINTRRIGHLETVARALYRRWIVDRRPLRGGADGSAAHDQETAAWTRIPLSQVVTTQYGFTAAASPEASGPKLLRGMDINKTSYIDWSTVPHCQIQAGDFRRFSLEVGDVCVVRMADPGKVGIVEEPVEAVFASYLVRLRSRDPRLRPQTLFHFLDSPEYQARITASSTGATRRSASAGVLTEPEIVLPPQGITEDFERRAATVRGQLAALVRLNASVARTRDLLLPRLVSGRLDISDVDLGTLTPAQEAA